MFPLKSHASINKAVLTQLVSSGSLCPNIIDFKAMSTKEKIALCYVYMEFHCHSPIVLFEMCLEGNENVT